MEKKITQIGNSLGIVIPNEIMQGQKLEKGDRVDITLDENGNIVVKPLRNEELRPEVLNIAHGVMEKYKETLKGLQTR